MCLKHAIVFYFVPQSKSLTFPYYFSCNWQCPLFYIVCVFPSTPFPCPLSKPQPGMLRGVRVYLSQCEGKHLQITDTGGPQSTVTMFVCRFTRRNTSQIIFCELGNPLVRFLLTGCHVDHGFFLQKRTVEIWLVESVMNSAPQTNQRPIVLQSCGCE